MRGLGRTGKLNSTQTTINIASSHFVISIPFYKNIYIIHRTILRIYVDNPNHNT